MEEIIHNECGCLFTEGINDPQCLKRSYRVYDVVSGRYSNISICNEYIRLLINKKYLSPFDLEREILRPIFEEHIKSFNDGGYYFNRSNDLTSTCVSFTYCDRPFMYSHINIIKAIQICLDNPHGYWDFKHEVFTAIKDYLNKNTYQKYKTKYKKCIAICNTLIKKFHYQEDREILILELFTIINELNIKNK